MRARPAINLADSILQTASIARCVSLAGTVTDHTTFNPPVQDGAPRGKWMSENSETSGRTARRVVCEDMNTRQVLNRLDAAGAAFEEAYSGLSDAQFLIPVVT